MKSELLNEIAWAQIRPDSSNFRGFKIYIYRAPDTNIYKKQAIVDRHPVVVSTDSIILDSEGRGLEVQIGRRHKARKKGSTELTITFYRDTMEHPRDIVPVMLQETLPPGRYLIKNEPDYIRVIKLRGRHHIKTYLIINKNTGETAGNQTN